MKRGEEIAEMIKNGEYEFLSGVWLIYDDSTLQFVVDTLEEAIKAQEEEF